jgi:hypothetical protein
VFDYTQSFFWFNNTVK